MLLRSRALAVADGVDCPWERGADSWGSVDAWGRDRRAWTPHSRPSGNSDGTGYVDGAGVTTDSNRPSRMHGAIYGSISSVHISGNPHRAQGGLIGAPETEPVRVHDPQGRNAG